MKGSDDTANHAIGVYNRLIFDADKRVAIPLGQENLDYCVTIKEPKNEFVSFTGGFFFLENSKQRRLKRKAEGDNLFDSTITNKPKETLYGHFIRKDLGTI